MTHESTRPPYTISTDPARLDPVAIHAYLTRSYWATGRPYEIVVKALQNSLCFGVYDEGEAQHSTQTSSVQTSSVQIGLARVITDYATFAYLCDVYILEEHQGQGLGKWLIETVVNSPELQPVRRFLLATRDAHGLYSQYGFELLTNPERWMQRLKS